MEANYLVKGNKRKLGEGEKLMDKKTSQLVRETKLQSRRKLARKSILMKESKLVTITIG